MPVELARATCAGGEVTDEQRQAILDALAQPEVAPYIQEKFEESKEEAFERFQEQFGDQSWRRSRRSTT